MEEKNNPKREPVEVAAIIPARAGQQSIPYKNLQKLGDKTLLEWAIAVAFEAESIDIVIVSTEDPEVAKQAKAAGALVAPRPAEFSQPTSGDGGFYHHAVTWMEQEFGYKPELLVNLRPTSPLRFASDIDAMVAHMKTSDADGLKSVIPAPLHPYKMWHLESDGAIGSSGKITPLADFQTDFRADYGPDQPRQKIQKLFPIFFQDAQIDITRRKFILRPECLENENVWGENIHGYVLDARTSTDLDEPDDFLRAERLYKQMKQEREI